MADEYLPPVVVEIITRATGFNQGVSKVKADMATAAAAVEGDAAAMGGAVERETKHVEARSSGFATKTAGIFSGLGNMLGGTFLSEPFHKMGAKIEEADHKGQGLRATLAGLGKTAAIAGAVGFAAVATGAIELADKFDTAQATLETAVKNAGGSFDKLKPHISATYSAMAKLGFNSTDTATALQKLTTATQDPTKAMGTMALAANLARMQHISLTQASQMLAMAFAGNTRMLTRLGINLDIGSGKLSAIRKASEAVQAAQMHLQQVQDKVAAGTLKGAKASDALQTAHLALSHAEEKLRMNQSAIGDAMHALEGRTKGMAAAYGKTLPGQIAIAKAELHNLGTELGVTLTPIIVKAIGVIMDIVHWFGKHKTAAIALAAVIAGVLTVALAAWIAEMAIAVAEMSPIILAIGAVVAAGIFLAANWKVIWKAVSGAVKDAVGAVVGVIKDVVGWIKDHWKILAAVLLGPIGVIIVGFVTFKNQIIAIMSTVVQAIVGVWNTISGAFTTALNAIETGLTGAATAIVDAFKAIPDTIAKIATTIIDAFTSLPGDVLKIAGDIVQAFVNLPGDIAGALSSLGSAIATQISNGLGALGSSLATPVGNAINGLISSIPGFFSGLASTVVGALASTGTAIVKFFGSIPSKTLSAVSTLGSDIAGFFKTLPGKIGGAVTAVVSTVVHFFESIPGKIIGALSSVGGTLAGFFRNLWNDISGPLGGLFNKIFNTFYDIGRGIYNALRDAVSGVAGFFKGIINDIISGVNWVIRAVDSVHVTIPGWVPGVGGDKIGFSIPQIPYLAEGGIVTRPTLAVVGEAGPEAVIPLGGSAPASLPSGIGSTSREIGDGAAGTQVEQNFYMANGPSVSEVAQEVLWRLRPYLNAA